MLPRTAAPRPAPASPRLTLALLLLLGATVTTPAPARGASTAEGPLDVTREFYKALHADKARTAAKLTANEDAEAVMRSFVRISRSYRELEAAIAKRFGAEAAGDVGYGRKVQAEIKGLLGATVEIEGDRARVAGADGTTISTLRRVRGAWKVELEDLLETAEGRAAFAAQAKATSGAAKQVIAALKAGKYPTSRAAVDDFEARVARAAAGVRREAPPPRPAPEPEGTQL